MQHSLPMQQNEVIYPEIEITFLNIPKIIRWIINYESFCHEKDKIYRGSQVNSFGTLTNNKSNLLNRVYTGCSTKKVFQGGVFVCLAT